LISATSWTDTEENLVSSAKSEIAFYHSFAENYFKEYSDIKFLDKRLNDKPDNQSFGVCRERMEVFGKSFGAGYH